MSMIANVRARIHRPSPALVVAFLALLVAIGGVAFAAAPGPGGIRRINLVSKDSAANSKQVTVNCASNERAVGGGFSIAGKAIAAKIATRSFPVNDPPTAWQVKAFDATGGNGGSWRIRAYAVCVSWQ
jgi:hypothetical protein